MERAQASRFGIEFFLLIALPLAVIIAGAATMTLAYNGGFTPLPESQHLVNPR
ncbi:hypothetical protein [Solimonas soli]|uniref:hypothetical protein n=1 Tax=Solimonas soli TaxID=413479 RepID=UPI0004B80255|nr:hypothetical protein [Solimonas soli]